MGILDGLNEAKVFETGTFFETPEEHNGFSYEVDVERILVKKTRKSGMCFIVETRVTASNSAKDPVGSRRTWLQKLEPSETAFPAVKSFMYALLGYNFAGEDKEFCIKQIDPQLSKPDGTGITDAALSAAQPFAKRHMKLETLGIITVEKKKLFTRHNWQPNDTKVGAAA